VSTYDWPARDGAPELVDDPRGRRAFVGPRRVELDAEAASAAARRTAAPSGRRRPPAAPPSGRANLWVPLGPTTVVGSQPAGQPRIAGRVNALAISTDGLRVYAASGNGGIWFSADAGATWRALGGFAATPSSEIDRPATRNAAGAIALRPHAPDTIATDELFVGTGEPYHFQLQMVSAQAGRSRGGIGILTATGPAQDPANNNPWTREAPNLVGEAVSRIALQPGGAGAVAATSKGLYARPAAPGLNVDWDPVGGTPFADVRTSCTDAVWTPAVGPAPERLWVWVYDGPHSGLWVRDAGSTDFRAVTSVAPPGTVSGRAALAASTPANQVWLLVDSGTAGVAPSLYRIANTGAALPVATQVVNGVTDFLNGFGFYDLALTVDPTRPNRVVVGGSTAPATAPDLKPLRGNRTNDAAVIWADVALNGLGQLTFGQPNPPTMVGVGVHADVHDVRFSGGGARLWVACDGGVFRSDHPAAQVGFFPRNTGLSVIESNYLATHPTCEGFVTTGLQDNGVITRLSSTVWQHAGLGDGGGILLDPLHSLQRDRWFRQFFKANWETSDGTVAAGTLYTRLLTGSTNAEFSAAAFYSTPGGIAHRRGVVPPPNPNVAQIIVGTNRLWYTEDLGLTWVTLPTATDPLTPAVNLAQDSLGESITVCRWQSPDVAWVLTNNQVRHYHRDTGSDNLAPPGTWHSQLVVQRTVAGKKDRKSQSGPMRKARLWTELAVNELRGPLGAVYLGTIGDPDDDDVDTLWWFDGTNAWHPTGLRKDSLGVPAPVTVVTCDPAHPEEVWVGTTVGVWRGIRTLPAGGTPKWAWQPMVNGLPESSVEDLAIFSDGGIRLLRAALASRGLWELQLDVAQTRDLTYVRAHDDDLRYRARAVERMRDQVTRRSWHGSPDVRPRVASAPLAPPGTLPWQRGRFANDVERLRRFQAALRSHTGDPRVRATGRWDDYFNEVLRANGAPSVPPPPPPPPPGTNIGITAAFWATHMVAPHSSADPWGADTPTEEDLYELTPPLVEGDLGSTSCRLPARQCKVDVVVHHRGLDPRPGGDVRVALLRWIDDRVVGRARWNNSANWVPDPVPWTAAVNNLLNGVGPPANANFAHGWRLAETNAANWMRTLAGQTLDNTRSGVVTFDLDLRGLSRNTVVILVAVIRAGTGAPADNIALAAGPLRLLALDNPQVAVRSIRIGT
jgi:hypothetical protein